MDNIKYCRTNSININSKGLFKLFYYLLFLTFYQLLVYLITFYNLNNPLCIGLNQKYPFFLPINRIFIYLKSMDIKE